MINIVGLLLVVGAVIGGYLLEHGNLMVLVQPAEFVIIGGAALGTMIAANPLHVLMKAMKSSLGMMKGSPFNKVMYTETLQMLYDLFSASRKNGATALEKEIEDPGKGPVMSKYKRFLSDKHAVTFLCDTLRTHLMGGVSSYDLDQMMELDIEVHHHEATEPVTALTTVAESLPGLGIVAAVLGVVITMGALGGPPEEIGHKVAAALVGTFLGILACYGFIGPIAMNLTKRNQEEQHFYDSLRNGVLGFAREAAPIVAVELARRTVPNHVRPSFQELEKALKGSKG